jgi:hypothetical protein
MTRNVLCCVPLPALPAVKERNTCNMLHGETDDCKEWDLLQSARAFNVAFVILAGISCIFQAHVAQGCFAAAAKLSVLTRLFGCTSPSSPSSSSLLLLLLLLLRAVCRAYARVCVSRVSRVVCATPTAIFGIIGMSVMISFKYDVDEHDGLDTEYAPGLGLSTAAWCCLFVSFLIGLVDKAAAPAPRAATSADAAATSA